MEWEYKIVGIFSGFGDKECNQEQLNSLGEEGWELVTVDRVESPGSCGLVAYLKKPLTSSNQI